MRQVYFRWEDLRSWPKSTRKVRIMSCLVFRVRQTFFACSHVLSDLFFLMFCSNYNLQDTMAITADIIQPCWPVKKNTASAPMATNTSGATILSRTACTSVSKA